MADVQDYEPCTPVISILTGSINSLEKGCRRLRNTWETFRLFGPSFLFSETNYYREEMGEPLFRWWGYRHTLADPAGLADWKTTTDGIEDELRDQDGNRSVNIDPGYLDLGLLVLGSHKNHHQKIYLGDGVYADPVLEYVDGSFRPFHWSFPDFQDNQYFSVLERFRERYKTLRNEGL
ncbi:MAG: DUF4416 family protein [bacterium]